MLLTKRYRPTSHEALSHRDLDSLGYDWERVANPDITPKRPLRVYLPQTTDDVVRAVREAKQLGETLRIRGKGHSSNDLVLEDRGTVLWTEYLNRVLDVAGDTVTMQSGAVLADVDAQLGAVQRGLPVIGDHDDITAGGFASVGGVSPASHRWGMFVDTITELEYVDWDGNVVRCGEHDKSDAFYRILAGTGRHGVITTLTCRTIPADKRLTIVENHRIVTRDLARFVDNSDRIIREPGEAEMERGLWLDVPVLGKPFAIGQFSAYHRTNQGLWKSLRAQIAHGWLYALGYVAGRLPRLIDRILQYLGVAGIVFAPRYASIKHVERFADIVIDSSVGDPSRMLIVFAPAERYPAVFHALYELCLRYRRQHGCLTFISLYVKGIKSKYLSGGKTPMPFCEVVLYLGIDPERMSEPVLDALVSDIDALCIDQHAFRYMHTKTSKDLKTRASVDPNARYGLPPEEIYAARAGESR